MWGRLFMSQPASSDLLHRCMCCRVGLNVPVPWGGHSKHSITVISAASSGPGWTTQAVTQTDFLVFFNQHFRDLENTLCHCPALSTWDRWDWRFSNHLLWLCPKMIQQKRWMVQRSSEGCWGWFMGAVWRAAALLRPGQALFVIPINMFYGMF